MKVWIGAFAIVLGSQPASAFQALTAPTDVQMPGTQPGEVSALESPNKCDNCHGGYDSTVEPAYNWRGSMMAQATRDPIFWATVAIAEQDFSGAGDLCIRCHSPEGWLGGRSTPTDGSALKQSDATGVMCDLCHQMVDSSGLEHPGAQFPPFVANDEETSREGYHGSGMYVLSPIGSQKEGPYDDPPSPHASEQSFFHRSPDMCGTCHDVSNPVVGDLAPENGAQQPIAGWVGVLGGPVENKIAFNAFPFQYGIVERTYSEHMASLLPVTRVADFEGLPVELQDGALQAAYDRATATPENGGNYVSATRYFTCQSCHMPPVIGKGCNKSAASVRTDLPLHDLTGGNTWLPGVILDMDARGELLFGNVSATEAAALGSGAQRALDGLRNAAALHVDDDVLRVVNLTGHKLISGYPEGRRMWLNVRWFDAKHRLVREDGAFGRLTVLLDGVETEVETILDLQDPHLRIYEAHMGISMAWAQALVGLGYPNDLALSYDRLTGAAAHTLGELASGALGEHVESFHFVLNDTVVSDNRIPPYGLDHAEAERRNVLPVPETQYGWPESGARYEHFDEVPLDPPREAVSARIRLLYQPTSWEYVQFLYLANEGGATFLGQEGARFLAAWQRNAMAPPVTMATATWRRLDRELPAAGRVPVSTP